METLEDVDNFVTQLETGGMSRPDALAGLILARELLTGALASMARLEAWIRTDADALAKIQAGYLAEQAEGADSEAG